MVKHLNRAVYGCVLAGAALALIAIPLRTTGIFIAGIALLASGVLMSVPILLTETVPRTRLLSLCSAAIALLAAVWLVVPALHQVPMTAVPLAVTAFVLAYVWWRVERRSKTQ